MKLLTACTLAALAYCASGTAQAGIVTYTSQAAYLAAIANPGVDTYNNMPLNTVPSPINRTAGPYTYSASASTSSFFPAGAGADHWLSLNIATDQISLYGFSTGVRGVGGFFFGSDIAGSFLAGQSITVTATDAGGPTVITLNNATTSTFLGFVADDAFTSITVAAVQVQGNPVWPTINDLTLGEGVAVPEPGQIASGAVLLLGVAGYAIRRRQAAK